MKRGSFPMWPAFPTSEYYDPLRLPLGLHSHFPGSPVIGRASLPSPRRRSAPRRLSRVPRTTIRTFNAQYAGGFLSARSWTKSAFPGLRRDRTGSAPSFSAQRRGKLTTLTQASLTCRPRDRSAPLRTRSLDHARGHFYQEPRRLPGPDSHRQAALNLSLLRHVVLLSLMAPEQSRRTRSKRQRQAWGSIGRCSPHGK